MFDYFSAELDNRVNNDLLSNQLLCFTTPINEETGELIHENHYHKRKVAKFDNLTFTIYTNMQMNTSKLYLQGSIHKYCSSGVNHTDFDLNALKTALISLKTKFNIDIELTALHSLEFGVNIRVPFSCSRILKNLLSYKGIAPTEDQYNGKGQMTKFRLSQYTVKVYNKGLQYYKNGLLSENTDDLLRFEIHIDRMAYIHKKGINVRTLADLLNPDYHIKLGALLCSTLSDIVLNDFQVDGTRLKPKDRQFLKDCNNPRYWTELTGKPYTRKLQKFRTIIAANTDKNIQSTLLELVQTKWQELSKNVPILQSVENANMSRNYTYIVCNNETLTKRYYCKVTGIDITHQPGKRNYVSEQTLNQMKFNNPVQYYELFYKYPPRIYDDTINQRIAKKIRNTRTNRYNGLKRRVIRSLSQTSLFNADEVLTLTTEQRDLLATY